MAKEKASLKEDELTEIAKASGGGFRDAETLLEQVIAGGQKVGDLVGVATLDNLEEFFDFLIADETSPALIRLLRRCLAKDAGERPVTAAEVRVELERIDAGDDPTGGGTVDTATGHGAGAIGGTNRRSLLPYLAGVIVITTLCIAWLLTRAPHATRSTPTATA